MTQEKEGENVPGPDIRAHGFVAAGRERLEQNTKPDPARQPRRGFLYAALLFSGAAVAAYLYQDEIIAGSPGGNATPFAVLLAALVLIALMLLLCYRVPRIGNRLLGYDIGTDRAHDRKAAEGYHYTGAFRTETGADTKKAASKRLQARHTRRKYARATRVLQEGEDSHDPETS